MLLCNAHWCSARYTLWLKCSPAATYSYHIHLYIPHGKIAIHKLSIYPKVSTLRCVPLWLMRLCSFVHCTHTIYAYRNAPAGEWCTQHSVLCNSNSSSSKHTRRWHLVLGHTGAMPHKARHKCIASNVTNEQTRQHTHTQEIESERASMGNEQ